MSAATHAVGSALSDYAPGARVLEHLVRRQGLTLPAPAAAQQWQLVREHLLRTGLPETVEEAEASESGSLDTLEREDVLDAWAKVATGRAWPCFGEGQPSREAFLDAYFLHLRQLGARRLGMPAPRSSL